MSTSNSRPSFAHLSLFVSRLFPSCRPCRWRQCLFNERSHCRTWHNRSSLQPQHHCRGKKLVSWAAWGEKRSVDRSTRARDSGRTRFCTWLVRRLKWVSSVFLPDCRNLLMLTMARHQSSPIVHKNKREHKTALGRVLRFISDRVLHPGSIRKNITRREKRDDSIIGSRTALEISIQFHSREKME